MGHKAVTLLWMMVGVLFLVTSKPISLNTAADESDSDEANSSEEALTEEVEEVEEPELPETTATESTVTEVPNVVTQTEPLVTLALPISMDTTALPVSVDTTVIPAEAVDPQTSTDGMQMLPADPSQATIGVDVSQDMPKTDPAHDPPAPNMDAPVEAGIPTEGPQQQTNDVQYEVLPTLYPPYVKGKSTHVSVVNAVPVHINNPLMPVCFTFHTQQYHAQHYAAPRYNPPRGDSY